MAVSPMLAATSMFWPFPKVPAVIDLEDAQIRAQDKGVLLIVE